MRVLVFLVVVVAFVVGCLLTTDLDSLSSGEPPAEHGDSGDASQPGGDAGDDARTQADATAGEPAAEGVSCGASTCAAGERCCFGGTSSRCLPTTQPCAPEDVEYWCDGPADCPSPLSCCMFLIVGIATGTRCAETCGSRACTSDADCGDEACSPVATAPPPIGVCK